MGSLTQKGYLGVPVVYEDEKYHRRLLAEASNRLLFGKFNNISSAKLTQNASSTTVSDVLCGAGSLVVPMPTSSNAALAFDTWFVKSRAEGSFVIDHVSTSTSDCTFNYAIFG